MSFHSCSNEISDDLESIRGLEAELEDRFRDVLRKALEQEGMSATDLAREFGLDKAYFVDLLAGRKKTVSALVYMMAAKRLSFDPWEVASVEPPSPVRELPKVDPNISPAPSLVPRAAATVEVSMFVEEGAFREGMSGSKEKGLPIIPGVDAARQLVAVVKGGDYFEWGIPSGSLLHLVSYRKYDGVAPGRLVVARSERSGLSEHVLRRAAVSDGGELVLGGPGGRTVLTPGADTELVGLVTGLAFPHPASA